MNRYACYFADNQGCIVLNATDDEDAAWLAEAQGLLDVLEKELNDDEE